MKKLKAVWELMRLEHGVMLFIAILIGSVISQRVLDTTVFPPVDKLILAFFTVLFLEASTFALNDYYDFEIDKLNKRTDRPLVRGDLSLKTALYLFYIFFPLGLLCSFFVNYTCFIIALVTALFAILYDTKMKKIKLLGNFYIAYTMAIPFVFGAAAVIQENTLFSFEIHPSIYIIALMAFLAGSGREIMKDVQDFKGDFKKGVRSFPKYIGKKNSNIIASLFYLSAIALSFLPYISANYEIYYRNIYYIVIILITDIMLLVTAVRLIQNKTENMKVYRKMSLIAMFVGLIAFLVGAFV